MLAAQQESSQTDRAESRTERATCAVTKGEKAALQLIAASRRLDVSGLIRQMCVVPTLEEHARVIERLRATDPALADALTSPVEG